MKVHFPVYRSRGCSIFRSSRGIIHQQLYMGIRQFSLIDNRYFIGQVNTMALQEETSQNAFNRHSFHQIGRINGYPAQSDFIHFYFSFYQRPCLYTNIETFQRQKGIRLLNNLHTTYQQIKWETKVYPLHLNLHAGCFRSICSNLPTQKILNGRNIKQYH